MSRRNGNNRNNNRNNRNDRNDRIPDSVKEFAEMRYKDYKKENEDYFDSKKEMRRDYFMTLTFDLPDVIEFVLEKGHIQNPKIQEIKGKCYAKLGGPEGPAYVKYLTKELKKYDGNIKNIKFLPIILFEIISDIMKFNAEHADQPEAQIKDPDEIYELFFVILKKRLKKAEKQGINRELAIDLLGVIPHPSIMEYSPFFRARAVFDIIYRRAEKSGDINISKLFKFLIKEEDFNVFIGYALQERKDKCKGFNNTQKKVFNDINGWVFDTLEENMSKNEIEDILINYIKVRKKDAAAGKDSNRRYFISSLPESLYPKINSVVTRIKANDPEAEKYL